MGYYFIPLTKVLVEQPKYWDKHGDNKCRERCTWNRWEKYQYFFNFGRCQKLKGCVHNPLSINPSFIKMTLGASFDQNIIFRKRMHTPCWLSLKKNRTNLLLLLLFSLEHFSIHHKPRWTSKCMDPLTPLTIYDASYNV